MVNNADWLTKLLYIPFLREVGRHFSVNQMLAMETYRTRLETGLSFLEFNYLLLQSYDFLHLYREHGCVLQVGGGDQWSNCLGGMDLIRRADGGEAFVMTTPLIATASGEKMGKSAGNAVWLDPARTSPYDYYQFWINTEDADVGRFLAMFTFLPMDEVRRLGALEGAGLRAAKERLAFEATALTHGEAEAREQRERARGIMTMKTMKWNQIDSEDSGNVRTMGWNRISQDDTPMSDDTITLEGMKSQEWLWDGLTTRIPQGELEAGLPLSDLFVRAGLVSSRNEARRLASQGGASVDLNRVDDMDRTLTTADIPAGGLLLRAGKKRYQRIVVA